MKGVDQSLFLWINLSEHAPAWLMGLARLGATVLPALMLMTLFVTLVSGSPRWRRASVHMLLAMLLAWLVVRGIGAGWPTPRPFVLGLGKLWMAKGASPSFPSSHATIAWTVALAACHWSQSHLLRAAFVLVAMLIGWARIALGVHFPLDILGGLAVGAVCAWASLPAASLLGHWLGSRFRLPSPVAPALLPVHEEPPRPRNG